MLLSVLLTVVGMIVGGVTSWYISRHYFHKGLARDREAERILATNLQRLLIHAGLSPEKVLSSEVWALVRESATNYLTTDRDGDTFWKYCNKCGSERIVRKNYLAPKDVEESIGVERKINGARKGCYLKYTDTTATIVQCLECKHFEIYPRKGAVRALRNEQFTITIEGGDIFGIEGVVMSSGPNSPSHDDCEKARRERADSLVKSKPS